MGISAPEEKTCKLWRVITGRGTLWPVYVLAVAMPGVLCVVRLVLGFQPGDPVGLVLWMTPTLFSAYLGGLGPGLLTTLVGSLSTNYFFIQPVYSLCITDSFRAVRDAFLPSAAR
ncbi:MAG: DUF4118 domain-containing protein [Candidatus Tectimicrobiota bacterium]